VFNLLDYKLVLMMSPWTGGHSGWFLYNLIACNSAGGKLSPQNNIC
jgi:hypothetical protein